MIKYISLLAVIFSILVVSPSVKAESTSDQTAVSAVSDHQGDLGIGKALGSWGRTPKR